MNLLWTYSSISCSLSNAVCTLEVTFYTTSLFHHCVILLQIPDNSELGDVEGQYEYCSCDKYNYLIGSLYIIKGFVVLFGLFLAYETRSVSYKYINDFKYVRIATYVVVIMVGICAPMSLLFAQQWFINSAYSISVLLINTACVSCLLILFIPKVSSI